MAHWVTGIDIGAYSIKAVTIDAGFRRVRIVEAVERVVPAGDVPLADRQREILRQLAAEQRKDTSFFVALPGEVLSMRELELPFSDARKVAQVLPYELEGTLLAPLDEVVYDHMMLPGAGERAQVVAVAARQTDVATTLAGLEAAGITPRALYAAPLCYRAEAGEAPGPADAPVPDDAPAGVSGEDPRAPASRASASGLTLLLDVGHQRSNVVVLRDGLPVFARTLLRGGKQLTDAVAASFGVPWEQAEQAKRQHGVVGHAGFRPDDAALARLAHVLREALAPLVRELRQTLASVRARLGAAPRGLALVGGGASQRGLGEALEEELGIARVPYTPVRPPALAEQAEALPDARFALAEAIAWSSVLGERQLDLRRGPFVYRASFSVVRQKAAHLVALAVAVLVAIVLDATMAYSKAHKQRERLEADLVDATTELFGKPDRNAATVARLMSQGFREELPPIPSSTAFDLLREISERMPGAEDIKVDVLELDIRPRKTFIKGIIDSVASVDKVVEALKEIGCFEEISKGAITEVAGGDKQFTLTVKATCP